MNFLSHFYFDRETMDPHLVLGSVLPDLVKNARKEWIIHPEKNEHQFTSNAALSSILKGWNRHLEVDRQFHSSGFFKTHTEEIRTAIAPILINSPARAFFVAHIALELMLDSLLLTESIIQPDDFYRRVKESDKSAINLFLELNNITNTEIFFNFFEEFLEAEYLHTYAEAENIMYAISRICMRIWANPFSETQKLQLTAVLISYQQKLKDVFMNIFDEIDLGLV